MSKSSLGDVNEYLKKLVAEACAHAGKTEERQKKLGEIIRVVMESEYLWWENTPYYEDALQHTWAYFCNAPERYNPADGTVLNWLNTYLKWRLSDLRQADWKAEVRRRIAAKSGRKEEREERIEVDDEEMEEMLARPDIPRILEETRRWVETDLSGELRKTHVKDRPDVNCQVLILLRLPPEVRWGIIAKKFELPKSTAPNFYKREASPRLRKFGVEQGYLD